MEFLLPSVGNATGPQIGKEILVPSGGNFISQSGTGITPPTLLAASTAPGSITTSSAIPRVTFTRS